MSAAATHMMRWTFDRDSVFAEAVCLAEPGADCRLDAVSCECEMWGEIQRRNDGTIWHRIVDGGPLEPQWHEVKPQDDCNACLFINESGIQMELGPRRSLVIAETPIEPVWVEYGCDWDFATEEAGR